MEKSLRRLRDSFDKMIHVLNAKGWAGLVAGFGTLAILMSIFASISDEVTEHETTGFDEAVLITVHRFSSQSLDVLVSILTEFGGLIGVAALTGGIVALFAARRWWRRGAFMIVAVLGAGMLNLLLKATFQRDRPDLWEHIVTELTYSFPSGHAMASMALGAAMIIAFWHTRYRLAAVILGVIYVLLIAFTRLYLGVHYPTDILAGWCASLAWVVFVKTIFDYTGRRSKTL